ncbi:MAG: N-acetyltransferase [Burkholderiales bacterium]|nr:N-acetyltransferase [Burkholderiales bacterium]
MSVRSDQTSVRILGALAEAPAEQWDRLAPANPLSSHAFLHGLETSGCVSASTGWIPCHVTLWRRDTLIAAMPLYLKDHSYGEYVFDWAWADAYRRHGLAYYPKLVCAVPFTPITGERLMAHTTRDRNALLGAALAFAERSRASSLHVLFPSPSAVEECREAGMLVRKAVQFHWTNPGYRSFDDFLAQLTRDKRKKIRQERRRVHEQGIGFRWLDGATAKESDWAFFERCYRKTYREHRSTPYLNLEFFLHLAQRMPHNVLLIQAYRDGKPIAATFNIVAGREALYGRNWGAIAAVPLLHFEACYYQSIEYCIAHDIGRFEGGAQGEHKMARGLMPVETCSAHWVAHAEFRRAIAQYLARETHGIGEYVDELNERSPYHVARLDAATS